MTGASLAFAPLTSAYMRSALQLRLLCREACPCAGLAATADTGAVPRGWTHWHASDSEFHRLQTPSLHLPLADPATYLEQHGDALGHNARNVMRLGSEVIAFKSNSV